MFNLFLGSKIQDGDVILDPKSLFKFNYFLRVLNKFNIKFTLKEKIINYLCINIQEYKVSTFLSIKQPIKIFVHNQELFIISDITLHKINLKNNLIDVLDYTSINLYMDSKLLASIEKDINYLKKIIYISKYKPIKYISLPHSNLILEKDFYNNLKIFLHSDHYYWGEGPIVPKSHYLDIKEKIPEKDCAIFTLSMSQSFSNNVNIKFTYTDKEIIIKKYYFPEYVKNILQKENWAVGKLKLVTELDDESRKILNLKLNYEFSKYEFNLPHKIITLPNKEIIFCDTGNNMIRKVDIKNNKIFSLYGSGNAGYLNGQDRLSDFNYPMDITCDQLNNIYVSDTRNHCIRKINTRGEVTKIVGTKERGFLDGLGENSKFKYPSSLDITPEQVIYVSDMGNNCIRKLEPHIINII
jgi:hypothetical protein